MDFISNGCLRFFAEAMAMGMVTGDEKWVIYENNRQKRSWSKRGEPAQTIAKPGLTAKKVILCVWWDWKGIIP